MYLRPEHVLSGGRECCFALALPLASSDLTSHASPPLFTLTPTPSTLQDLFGTELCKKLREELSWEGVLVIQSANDGASDVTQYLAAGADACLGKGVGAISTVVVRTLARAYDQRHGERAQARMAGEQWARSERIQAD